MKLWCAVHLSYVDQSVVSLILFGQIQCVSFKTCRLDCICVTACVSYILDEVYSIAPFLTTGLSIKIQVVCPPFCT